VEHRPRPSRSCGKPGATAAAPVLFPSGCEWSSGTAEEPAPLCLSSSSSSRPSGCLVFPSFHLPVAVERQLLLAQLDEEAESSVWPLESPRPQSDDLSFTSRSVLPGAASVLHGQSSPASSTRQASLHQQSQQSVLSPRSPAAGSSARWSELDVPIFSSSTSAELWSSRLSSASDQPHLLLSSQLDSVQLSSPFASPSSPRAAAA
jgi:hypothetical protein